VIDSPSIEKIYKNKDLKFLFKKGFMEYADLVIIALDIIDCDIKGNKIGRVLKKNFNKKEFFIVLTKSDMFET
jgi:hypothetical protein